jgi:RNA-directed DNA polymerase
MCPLIQAASRLDCLNTAWKMVRAAGGSAGRDGVTIQDLKKLMPVKLEQISKQVASGNWQFQRLRSAVIPKENGESRKLGIPSVADRIVLQAIRLNIEPFCESQFHDSCHAYRPRRGAETAIDSLAQAMSSGFVFVAETDIRYFFDTIRHQHVIEMLRELAPEYSRSWLLQSALRINAGFWPTKKGLAQGSPLSPLLANVALIQFDRTVSSHGARLIRYADDMLMLATSQQKAEQTLNLASKTLQPIGLSLHPKKTRVLDSRTEEFEFLGFRFQPDRVAPTTQNWNRLHEEIRRLCSVDTQMAWNERIDRINGLLRSFAWYYQKADCGRMLWNLDHFIREQIKGLSTVTGQPKDSVLQKLLTASQLRDARSSGQPKRSGRRWNSYG